MNSVGYVDTLEHYLQPFARGDYKGFWLFQQDNAPDHTSSYTKEFFMVESFDVMEWPAGSPDMNPIEGL